MDHSAGGVGIKLVPMKDWGRDHWSTLAYLETRAVDHNGSIERMHMRCDPHPHPGLAHIGWRTGHGSKYPTRLREGELQDHDDWSCMEDVEHAGLLENIGTGINPVVKLTDYGMIVCNALRNHKASGGSFGNFIFDPLEILDENCF